MARAGWPPDQFGRVETSKPNYLKLFLEILAIYIFFLILLFRLLNFPSTAIGLGGEIA